MFGTHAGADVQRFKLSCSCTPFAGVDIYFLVSIHTYLTPFLACTTPIHLRESVNQHYSVLGTQPSIQHVS